jgi:hypothetical protein
MVDLVTKDYERSEEIEKISLFPSQSPSILCDLLHQINHKGLFDSTPIWIEGD